MISVLTVVLCFQLDIQFHIDLTLLSIAIVFPLVFTIRGSFRRREKALEHLSQFRSALKTMYYFANASNNLAPEEKQEISDILREISDSSMEHLKNNRETTEYLDPILNKVQSFVDAKGEIMSGRLKDRIFRFMNDLHESLENLHAINTHRTPLSLKAYCKLFIYIFPFIYAPTIIHDMGADNPTYVTFFVVLLTEFILISLYNIQDQLEYPFDDYGLDDIKLDSFKIDR
ncbi:bestrophin family ion channel [Muriicola sp.]|uniref:bestrophin family ion channel n=1 Tax=Muriicola sp. TaxID=2020856 RepID=UPI00356875A3